jgi:hypothetical protein
MVRRLHWRLPARLALPAVLAAGLVLLPVAETGPGPVKSEAAAAARTAQARVASLPPEAQAAISARIGTANPAYAARRAGDGYRVEGGGVTGLLSSGGLKVDVPAGSLSMRLSAIGRGEQTTALRGTGPVAHRNRVSFTRPGLDEWYVAGPLGLEQGFTVDRRPSGGTDPVMLTLSLGGSLRARQEGAQVQFVGTSGAVALRLGGLVALDADRHRLPARLVLDGRSLRLRIDDSGARYPLWIDPFIQQGPKLTGVGAVGASRRGASTALSADGNTALVGGPLDSGNTGAVWVFTRTAGIWMQQGPKLASGGGQFGSSVALSADGNTALIGSAGGVGLAHVFTRSGGVWTQQGPALTGTGTIGGAAFGSSAALSADGNTALIGGYLDNIAVGAAWVFTRSGGVWTQQGPKLTGAGGVLTPNFGFSAALSDDGNTALIGAPSDDSQFGAAWVFTRSGGVWTQQGSKLTGAGRVGQALFGIDVALSSDGNTGLIGGFRDSGGAGAAWVFTRTGGVWTQTGPKLVPSDATGAARFGNSVGLSADGNTAFAGGPGDNGNSGAAWVFTRTGGAWTQQGSKLTGGGEVGAGWLGAAADLSDDGNTALAGGPFDNGGLGAAWVFVPTCAGYPITISGAGTIVGTAGSDVIVGSAGDDTIFALGGNDIVCGGLGNDFIDGGDSGDILYGDEGAPGVPAATASGGNDAILGGNGGDVIYGEGAGDFISGDGGSDLIDAGAGGDAVNAGGDGDLVYGGLDGDLLNGDAGSDFLVGDIQNSQNVGGGPGVDPTPGALDACNGGTGTDLQQRCEAISSIP